VRSHPKYFLRCGLNLKLLWPGHSIEQQASSLFFGLSTNKIVVFVVVARACSVVSRDGITGSAKRLDLWLIQQSSRVTRGVRVTTALFFFCFACEFFFVCFVVDPMFITGDLGHEFAQSA
jgi:hypothetical protein